MKRLLSLMFAFCLLLQVPGMATTQILDQALSLSEPQQIGDLLSVWTEEGFYLTDSHYQIFGGPYEVLSDYSGYPYAKKADGSLVLYDRDGSVLAEVGPEGDLLPPANGIYAIMPNTKDMTACREFQVYDYQTRTLLHTFDRAFMYYLESQTEQMVIEKDGKFAFCDKYGNFVTDYIYDEIKKRFNPDYTPFPKGYAIVVENGVEKYIDWNFNEIDLDHYNGEPFITNCWRMRGPDWEDYKQIYMLESGEKLALYDLATDTFIMPYQTEYRFGFMNDTYIIVSKGEESGVLDYAGNVVVPFQVQNLSFTEDGMIAYSYYDGEAQRTGILNPEDGKAEETPLGASGYFYRVLGVEKRDEIASATIVYEDGRCADISQEDLEGMLNVFWNFTYERVIDPTDSYPYEDYYFKLWNGDKSQSYIIYPNCGVILGGYGSPSISHGVAKENYVWYFPYVGNARNALYSKETELYQKYQDKTREATEADGKEIPQKNLLDVTGASDWAKPEIEKAAACNLLRYEIADYQKPITRLDFCKLAYRLIATEFSPESDSRMGIWTVIDNVINERGLREAYQGASFTDCENDEVKFLVAAGVIEGMGDGTFAPDSQITREQAAAILYRMANFLGNKTMPEIPQKQYYYDLDAVSDWAFTPVRAVYLMDIMHGVGGGTFDPQGSYTQEQAMATMLRLYECY